MYEICDYKKGPKTRPDSIVIWKPKVICRPRLCVVSGIRGPGAGESIVVAMVNDEVST